MVLSEGYVIIELEDYLKRYVKPTSKTFEQRLREAAHKQVRRDKHLKRTAHSRAEVL